MSCDPTMAETKNHAVLCHGEDVILTEVIDHAHWKIILPAAPYRYRLAGFIQCVE